MGEGERDAVQFDALKIAGKVVASTEIIIIFSHLILVPLVLTVLSGDYKKVS